MREMQDNDSPTNMGSVCEMDDKNKKDNTNINTNVYNEMSKREGYIIVNGKNKV